MCYHFKDDDTQDFIDDTIRRLNLKVWIHRGTKYYRNAFEFGKVNAIKQGGDEVVELEWGLIPSWVMNEKQALEHRMKTLNARSETIFNLPSFSHCIKKQKCLIFASGFYEWRHIDTKNKIPYIIGVKDDVVGDSFKPFTFGGIWDRWTNDVTGEVHDTCSIITVPANEMMALIHNSKLRMPLIISEEHQEQWLSAEDPKIIKSLMQPFANERMKAYPISKKISSRGQEKNVPEIYARESYPQVPFNEFI